jgi:hypothetical protein
MDSEDPPDADLVPKLHDLLKLYPKKKVEIEPIHSNQKSRFIESDDYGPNSYALYIHFALARYYRFGKEYADRPRVSFAMAAEQLDRVQFHAFAYHPNALALYGQCAFGQEGVVDDVAKQLLIDHYRDTAEFLAKEHKLFPNAEWRDTDEKYAKFRKTIPKPFPPPPPPAVNSKQKPPPQRK